MGFKKYVNFRNICCRNILKIQSAAFVPCRIFSSLESTSDFSSEDFSSIDFSSSSDFLCACDKDLHLKSEPFFYR